MTAPTFGPDGDDLDEPGHLDDTDPAPDWLVVLLRSIGLALVLLCGIWYLWWAGR